jgi:hypothetical protein
MGLAPVLTLTEKEEWYPQRAEAYLRESTIVDRNGESVAGAGAASMAVACVHTKKEPCLVIRDPRCPKSPACREWRLPAAPGHVRSDPRVVAYARVLRPKDHPEASWDVSEFGADLIGIAQWWLFAPYGEWTAPVGVAGATVRQSHRADWEAITIGYAANRVLLAAYSAHCGGSWRYFEDVIVPNAGGERWDVLGPRLHATAADADGSHAMYFEPESGRQPDSFSCEYPKYSGRFAAAAYAANVRDRTGDDVSVILGPVSKRESERILTLPAYWSRTAEVRIDSPLFDRSSVDGTLADPGGPPSPSAQALYLDPVLTIFCGRTWHHDGPG